MKNSEDLLKILSKFVESGILTSKDIKDEMLTNFQFKKDSILEKLQIVSREEFEILKLTLDQNGDIFNCNVSDECLHCNIKHVVDVAHMCS